MPLTRSLSIAGLTLASLCAYRSELEYNANRAVDTREAGSVHVAVLSVAPWERYVNALQPEFSLTADEAVSAVLRDSRRVQRQTLDAVGIAAEYKDTKGDAMGEVPGSNLQVAHGGQGPTSPWEGKNSNERPDAMLEYSAATSLYQEVQLLNRYVQDAAIPAGHRAYVVRMQISLMPRRRHEPYDAYATLGFFTTPQPKDEAAAEAIASRGAPGTMLRDLDVALGSDGLGARVIPLLVTENLESSFETRMAESLAALSLSLGSIAPGLASGVGIDALQSSDSASVYGRDLNGLLTVARLSENSLRVRLGAMQESTANYAMVPRTHNVTVLVTLPESVAPVVDLVTRTVLVDAESGVALPGTTREEVAALTQEVLADYALDGQLELASKLMSAAQANRQQEFMELLGEALPAEHHALGYAESLWIDLAALMAGSQYSSSRFELPGHGDATAELSASFHDQTPLLRDDGSAGSSVRIYGIRLPGEVQVEALLEVVGSSPRIALPADLIDRHDASGELSLVFPSLAALDLYSPEDGGSLRLRLLWGQEEQELDVIYRQLSGSSN